MTDDDFEQWWRHHIAVAFPNVRAWLANQCACDGNHDKTKAACLSSAIKKSWRDALTGCVLADAMAATDDCQRSGELRTTTPQDHPATIRAIALKYASSRQPVVCGEDFKSMNDATPSELLAERGEMRHSMRTLLACGQMRADAVAAGFGELSHENQRYWSQRLADSVRGVAKTATVEEYADQVIDGSRQVYEEIKEALWKTRGGIIETAPARITQTMEENDGNALCDSDDEGNHATVSPNDGARDHSPRPDARE